jgi:hypothetical protein
MKDMKLTKSAAKKQSEPSASDVPKYPWGLEVNLSNESLKALEMETLPDVGATMMLKAKVKVERVSASDRLGGGKDRTVELQITHMELSADKTHKDEGLAERLYGK